MEKPAARPAGQAAYLPMAFAGCLAAVTLLPALQASSIAVIATSCAAAALGVWNAVLLELAHRQGRKLTLEVVVRKQHWLQACAQGSVLVYWGWYWRPVYDYAPFILAQLLFAYGFDMLLSWSRRENYTLGFAPFPVIFSINLFLWFHADWFYLQYLLVALGLAAKELIRWTRDGRRVHIFNPSSFPLAVFSVVLIATGSSGITRGEAISGTQWYPAQMCLFLFLIGLPGQFFFGVTSMTMSAVLTTFAFSRIYLAMNGAYFFYNADIPIAVFLGMHLLFTDPSTSPRTELGRILFGVFYGMGTVLFFDLLGRFGVPQFYDKLLPVPILNLSVIGIDRLVRSRFLRRLDPAALGRALQPRQRNLAYMSVWVVAFVILSAVNGVGDNHPGQWLPFWQKACDARRSYACTYLYVRESDLCHGGSGWACNETGLLEISLSRSGQLQQNPDPTRPFRQGCELGFDAACSNLKAVTSATGAAGKLDTAAPTLRDYSILLQGNKGEQRTEELRHKDPASVYALACKVGWSEACGTP